MQYEMHSEDLICCAVTEISGISAYESPEEAVVDTLCEGYWDDLPIRLDPTVEVAHLIFTQAARGSRTSGYGYAVKDYIEQNKLGSVVASKPAKNPHTSNHVTVFVWTLDWPGIRAWAKRKRIKT